MDKHKDNGICMERQDMLRYSHEVISMSDYDKNLFHNTSIILKVTHGNKSFLFTGDAEREEEQTLLDKGLLKADVLKVGHHGSDTSTSYPFLREVMPEYAVI